MEKEKDYLTIEEAKKRDLEESEKFFNNGGKIIFETKNGKIEVSSKKKEDVKKIYDCENTQINMKCFVCVGKDNCGKFSIVEEE